MFPWEGFPLFGYLSPAAQAGKEGSREIFRTMYCSVMDSLVIGTDVGVRIH